MVSLEVLWEDPERGTPALTDVSFANLLRELPGKEGDGDEEDMTGSDDGEAPAESANEDKEEETQAKEAEEEEEKGEEKGEGDDKFDVEEVVRRRASTIRPNEARERKLTSDEVNTLVETGEALKKADDADPQPPAPKVAVEEEEEGGRGEAEQLPPTPPIGSMLPKTASDDDLPEPEVIGEELGGGDGRRRRAEEAGGGGMRRSSPTTQCATYEIAPTVPPF